MKKISALALAMAMVAGAASANTGSNTEIKQLNTASAGRHMTPVRLAQVAEEGITVPFTHSLGKKDSDITNLYTVVDANGDEKTWKPGGFTDYSVCMKPAADGPDTMDDWLISPAIKLEAAKTYSVTIETRCVLGSGIEDKLEICIGQGTTVANMTTSLHTIVITSNSWAETAFTFAVEADGLYNLGLHGISEKAKSGNLGACNLSVKEAAGAVTSIVPPAAGTIEYEVFPFGELKAHVTYTAPTKDIEGGDLDHIDHVTIINRWYEKFEYDDVVPGSQIKLDVDLFDNAYNNRIQATAYLKNSAGQLVAGEEALVTNIMAGYDYPLAPANVKATVSTDRKSVTVTWDPITSTVGESGGYVDIDNIKYYIFDAFGSYYDPAIAETTATSHTFDYSSLSEQDFFAYQITASYVHDGYEYPSLATNSNVVTAGPLIDMPFVESFADAKYQSIWMVDPESGYYSMVGTVADNYLQTNADDPEAEPEYINSQDGDNGFFYFLPMEKDELYGMQSLSISLADAKNPVIDFYAQGKGSVIDVLVSRDGGDLEVVETFDFMQNPTDGWTLMRTSLANYIGASYINFELRMRAIHNDSEHTWSLPIDNISVYDLPTDSAIDAIDSAIDAEPVYYSIDGRRMPKGRLAKGIYIRRTADKAEKVIIR